MNVAAVLIASAAGVNIFAYDIMNDIKRQYSIYAIIIVDSLTKKTNKRRTHLLNNMCCSLC